MPTENPPVPTYDGSSVSWGADVSSRESASAQLNAATAELKAWYDTYGPTATVDERSAVGSSMDTIIARQRELLADINSTNVALGGVAYGAEESPVTPGAATRTDTDQSDPSRVPAPTIAYDDEGNIMPGFTTDENNNAKWVGNQDGKIFVEPATQALADEGRRQGLPVGAEFFNRSPATAQWKSAGDMRVKIRVPTMYLTGPAATLKNLGGIIFPFTPTINYETQATYSEQIPIHSNFAQYFYQKSRVGPITVVGKFVNQNKSDATYYLATLHLLRSLTKMLWGKDPGAGAPPPVCRLDAYGDYMLNNIPVAVSQFKAEMPDSVDYIAVGNNMVPSIATISVTMNIMYSRQEIQKYSVSDWLQGNLTGKGYL